MAWIILEGIDRTGKSSVAQVYKNRKYKVVHFSAPDKKYMQPGYTGPSYVDEILELYLQHTGRDVVFDRSVYGEFVWPEIYGRKPLITDEDMDPLQEIEAQNLTQHILMYDADVASHWQRCVDNKEPLTKEQFKQAIAAYDRMATMYGFGRRQLKDFGFVIEQATRSITEETAASAEEPAPLIKNTNTQRGTLSPQEKLAQANAINEVLSKRILKKSGDEFDLLETEIKTFLQNRLSNILGESVEQQFSEEEFMILKTYCQRIKKRAEEK